MLASLISFVLLPANTWTLWVAVLSFLLVYWILWRNSRFVRLIESIPGPKGLPLFGNALQLNVSQVDFLKICHLKWPAQHGPIYKAWAGNRPVIVISDPELVEPILTSQKLISKSVEYSYLSPWLGNCMFLTTGSRWKSRRRLLTPAFHFQILSSFFDVFNEQSRVLVDYLNRVVDQQPDKAIDVFPVMTKTALDIICETSMGKQTRPAEETEAYVKSLHRIGQITMERGVRPWLMNDWIFGLTALGRENRRCVETLHKFTNQVIRDRRQVLLQSAQKTQTATATSTNNNLYEKGEDAPKERLAFLDLLINAAANGADLSDDDIREEVDTTMFAGHDTTASAMTWFLHCISKHPEEQQKIFDEVDAVFGHSDRPCTTHDMTQLKYLECCIKEALRLYPSVPGIMRNLTDDVEIGGYTLPAGASVAIVIYGMHHSPKVYPDPEEYKPERFLPENSVGRPPYAFIPFSAGPRNCIGQKYAMMEIKVVLSTVMRHFRFSSADPSSELLIPSSEVVLKPAETVPVIVQRRIKSSS
nr:CYP4BY4 protein [Diaphanosoma celebensis]